MNLRPLRRTSRTLALVALLPVLASGCYSFVPTALGSAPLGTEIRALLSEPAKRRLWAVVPPGGRSLDGRFIAIERDTLLLEVTIPAAGGTGGTFLQRIPLGRDEILLLQTRQLNRAKTAVVGGVFAAAAVGIVVRILTGEAGGGAWPPVDSGINELVMWLSHGSLETVQRNHSP